MTWHLRILPRARRDADRIVLWLLERDAAAAGRWFDAFEAAANSIERAPHSYSLAPEDEFVDWEIRQFFFRTRRGRTYRGLFTIIDHEIRVMRVRGPGQALIEPFDLH
jgi:plasmid stabilization system protein ParE